MSPRDVVLLVALAALSAAAVSVYGSPRWRQDPCEARWALCAAQLDRAGATAAEWRRKYLEEVAR